MELSNTRLGETLLPWAKQKRWWPTSSEATASVSEVLSLSSSSSSGDSHVVIALLRPEGLDLLIQVPLLLVGDNHDPRGEVIGTVGDYRVVDGVAEPEFWTAWADNASVMAPEGSTKEESRSFLRAAARIVQPLGVEQSNSSVLLLGADRPLIAKVYRALQGGLHPEIEIPLALDGWRGVPRLWAYYNLEPKGLTEPTCSAVVTDAVEHAEDGAVTLRAMANRGEDPSNVAFEIGALIADMHNRLEAELGAAPGPSNAEMKDRLETALRTTMATTDALSTDDVGALRATIEELTKYPSSTSEGEDATEPKAIRVHGDLHLGQLLRGADGKWNVVDFEGEPLRMLSERRMPDSPARDIAGMLRSFGYASDSDGLARPSWLATARASFVDGYQSVRPISDSELLTIRAYELDKALYELQYEAQFRPNWVRIPMSALRSLTGRTADKS